MRRPEDGSHESIPEPAGVDILVVEDSPTQAEQLRHLLEEHGHRVVVALDGREALRRLREHRPVVVVSDVIMPGMDGYELCRAIRADLVLRDIPVILLTSLSDPENVVLGLDCGADNFVVKPYDPEFILSRIHYVVINQELRRNSTAEMGIEIFFAGRKHFVTSDRMQIVDLLFSTFENAVHKSREMERVQEALGRALARLDALERHAPLCPCRCEPDADEAALQYLAEQLQRQLTAAQRGDLCGRCAAMLTSRGLGHEPSEASGSPRGGTP